MLWAGSHLGVTISTSSVLCPDNIFRFFFKGRLCNSNLTLSRWLFDSVGYSCSTTKPPSTSVDWSKPPSSSQISPRKKIQRKWSSHLWRWRRSPQRWSAACFLQHRNNCLMIQQLANARLAASNLKCFSQTSVCYTVTLLTRVLATFHITGCHTSFRPNWGVRNWDAFMVKFSLWKPATIL